MTCWTALLLLATADLPRGEELLARVIAYHDPGGTWMGQQVELRIQTGYADGRTRLRVATVDYATGAYRDRVDEDGHVLEQQVHGNECRLLVDGSPEADPARLEELGLSCERARTLRDYVSFLWGLPMKLRDPGARVAEAVQATVFQQRDALDLTITYDPEVGTDVWHMYADPATGRLMGYAFFKTPEEENGEYIVLEDEVLVGSARIPAKRHWYRVPGNEFLGTDTLLGARIVDAE